MRGLILSLFLAAPLAAAEDVRILHDSLTCWPQDQFLVVRAGFRPPTEVSTAKLYYRAQQHADFYFVELLTNALGDARTVVPMPGAGTTNVVYFIELVTTDFTAIRTEPQVVPVGQAQACRAQNPALMLYSGDNPGMVVGATRAGVPQLPPGFQANGIGEFISISGGATATGGGGVGKLPIILGGIGAGAGGAIFALSGSSGSENPGDPGPPIGGGSTSITVLTTTSVVAGGGGGSTTTSAPSGGGGGPTSTIPSASTTTVGSGASTSVPLGSTTTALGSTTTVFGGTTTTAIGSTTTTVGSSTTTAGSSTTTVGSSTTTAGSSTTTVVSTTTNPTTTTTTPPTTTSTTSTQRVADIGVELTAPGNASSTPSNFTVTVRAYNNGPDTAGIEMRLQIAGPPGATIRKLQGCGTQPPLLVCNLGVFPAGGSTGSLNFIFDADRGPVDFTLTYTTNVEVDPNPSNNSAFRRVNIN